MSDYYDLDGNPMTDDEWIALWRDRDARRVGSSVSGDVSVSTVWLGLDHSFGYGPPLIFETMIFGGEHDEDQWRYTTLAEAKAGHVVACELAGIEP